jgi:hypothetical protein
MNMTPLTQIELNTTLGGNLAFDRSEFFGSLGWVLAAGCAASAGNPAVCGAALVVGGINVFFF